MLEALKKFFSKEKKKDANEALVKMLMWDICYDEGIKWQWWELHHIDVKTTNDNIIVSLTLGKPGLVIGNGGRDVDGWEKKLSKCLGKPVKFELTEFNVWR